MPDTAKLRDRKPDLGVVGARLAGLRAGPGPSLLLLQLLP